MIFPVRGALWSLQATTPSWREFTLLT